MNPLLSIYSGVLSRLFFSLRLLGFLLVGAALLWSYHVSGLWDLYAGAAGSFPGSAFLVLASRNPLVHVEDLAWQKASFREQCLVRQESVMVSRPPAPEPVDLLAVLWRWLSAVHPLNHNPYPALRVARVREQLALEQLLCCYYLSTQIGAALVGILVLALWGGVWLVFQRPGAKVREGAHELLAEDLVRTPSTLSLPRKPFLSLGLPTCVLSLAVECRTARTLLEILAAHRQWPASLDHHGPQPGGLLAHPLRSLPLAVAPPGSAHPGAAHPELRLPFLLTVLAHDVGKVLAYAPHPAGGYVYRSYAHANKSADVLVVAGVYGEFPRDIADAVLTALRSSTSTALTPVPDNAPSAAKTLLQWLAEVDRLAVGQDVEDLKQAIDQANYPLLMPALFTALAPMTDLPPPLYREGGNPYLLRDPARLVLVRLLGLERHPGVRASTGRRDPVWEKLTHVLRDAGASTGAEEKIQVPGVKRTLSGIPVSPEFIHQLGA